MGTSLTSQLVALQPGSTVQLPSCPELCVHALAQLPSDVHLVLGTSSPAGLDLDFVAHAYGVSGRVTADERLGPEVARLVDTEGESIEVRDPFPGSFGRLIEEIGGGRPSTVDRTLDSVLQGHRVVIVTNYPAHYRLPLFERMSARLAEVGAQLHVVFLAMDTKSRSWLTDSKMSFQYETVASVAVPFVERGPRVPMRLGQRIRRLAPTIVLAGGFSPVVAGRAARVADEAGASFGLWSGETAVMPTAQQRTRQRFRRELVARADFAIAYGVRALDYLRRLRPDLPVVIGRNTAPVPAAITERATRPGLRPLRLLLIGDLSSARKGTDVALDAMKHLAANVGLDIVGDGAERSGLERRAGLDDRVRFLGALHPRDVAARLLETDSLLFPTRSDVFGLVLVEAMGAGAVPIVARAAGAVDDLAVDGHSAIVLDDHMPRSWAEAIERLCSDAALTARLASHARRTIEARWSMDHAADAMMAGLRLGTPVSSTRDRS